MNRPTAQNLWDRMERARMVFEAREDEAEDIRRGRSRGSEILNRMAQEQEPTARKPSPSGYHREDPGACADV